MDDLLGVGFFAVVFILTIVLFYNWYQTHIIISNGVEGEMQGCLSGFISMFLLAIAITTVICLLFASFWPYALGIGIIVLIYKAVKKHQ